MSGNYEHNIKISIVGDSKNGKTSLMNKFTINEFSENTGSTIGVDFRCKIMNINDKRIKIKIWDTAGQERFSEIIRACYRDSDGVIITYDTANYESFINLEIWLEKVINTIDRQYCSIILVGTKSDLIYDRKVSQEEVDGFILKHDLGYLEVSSKEGKNVDLLFTKMAEMIIEKIKDKPKKISHHIQKKVEVEHNCCPVM
jgi:small GTP-binding protein